MSQQDRLTHSYELIGLFSLSAKRKHSNNTKLWCNFKKYFSEIQDKGSREYYQDCGNLEISVNTNLLSF